MITNIKNYLIGAGILITLLLFAFIGGCQRGKRIKVCPDIITNVVHVTDTIIHTIIDTFPYYISHTDTIIYTDTIIQPVDTAAILRDYFALHIYSRNWTDSLLTVNLRDTVTQNSFLGNQFNYKILRPQTIINTVVDNSIHYNKYLYAGIDFTFWDMGQSEISLFYAFRGGYGGIGYAYYQKGFALKWGVPIAKFR